MAETNTSSPSQPLVVKLLVIVGFVATLAVIIWLTFEGFKRLPTAFSSLASMAEKIQTYRPVTDTPKTETVENQSILTDTKASVPTVPTVMPTHTESNETTTEVTNSKTPTTSTPISLPVVPVAHPQNITPTFADLQVSTIGSGVLHNGSFILTPAYSPYYRNSIQFVIKNIGTRTSDTWTFETRLPSGDIYTSTSQAPLKPQEQEMFTLGFDLGKTHADFVEIRNTVFSYTDVNIKNNSSVWTVAVRE